MSDSHADKFIDDQAQFLMWSFLCSRSSLFLTSDRRIIDYDHPSMKVIIELLPVIFDFCDHQFTSRSSFLNFLNYINCKIVDFYCFFFMT